MIKQMEAECSKFKMLHGIRVQVRHKTGQTVRTDAKTEPLRKTGCDRDDCLPCQSPSNRKGDCEKNSVNYQITCETCPKDGKSTTYKGETGRNVFTRGIEHQQGLRQRSEKSPLWHSIAARQNFLGKLFRAPYG